MAEELDDDDKKSLEALARIETKLGLPQGFVMALKDEGSDWEFAIKVGVVIEAAVGRVLIAHLHNPATAKHVRSLALNGRASKVALAVDLGILNKAEASAIQVLSEVRNDYAHRVENIQKTLAEFAAKYDEHERYGFVYTMALWSKQQRPGKPSDAVKGIVDDEFGDSFRPLMHWCLEEILNALSEQDAAADRERNRRETLERGENPFELGSGRTITLGEMLMKFSAREPAPSEKSPTLGGA